MPFAQHVLLVDDKPEVRTVLRAVLARFHANTTVVEASNGAEALLAFGEQRPDLIITDYQMPVMSGLELLRTLRSQGETLPILLLSSDPNIADVLLAEGASFFLPKPFPYRTMRDLLRTLLSEGEQAQAVGA